jgi:hypothetical protein
VKPLVKSSGITERRFRLLCKNKVPKIIRAKTIIPATHDPAISPAFKRLCVPELVVVAALNEPGGLGISGGDAEPVYLENEQSLLRRVLDKPTKS